MIDEQPLRIWIDDHNPIFRLGLGACLEPPFLLAGESTHFSPQPDLSRTDILVFELDGAGLPVDADGEFLGTFTEISFGVEPAALRVAC